MLMKVPKIITHEYNVLTGNWRGPYGAAFNACWEFCVENGLLKRNGELTPLGQLSIKQYEDEQK